MYIQDYNKVDQYNTHHIEMRKERDNEGSDIWLSLGMPRTLGSQE